MCSIFSSRLIHCALPSRPLVLRFAVHRHVLCNSNSSSCATARHINCIDKVSIVIGTNDRRSGDDCVRGEISYLISGSVWGDNNNTLNERILQGSMQVTI